jgi:lipid II:glycine glycyltransferase (peptidoglycan interpeptide bridge formation enzyme)
MVEVAVAGAGDDAAWHAFLAARPEADVLQSWAWGDACATDGERAARLIARDRDGRVRAVAQCLVMPTRLGRPFLYLPHGPIWEHEAPDGDVVLGAVIETVRTVASAERAYVAVAEPRAVPGEDAARRVAPLAALGFRRADRSIQLPSTRIVDLLDGGALLAASWHADARRLSKRSAREGVEVAIDRGGDPQAVATFSELLRATGERADFRPRSPAFLRALAAGSAARGDWTLAIARLAGRPIAGMAMPRTGDRAFYLYGASLREPELRHAYASYGTMARAMAELVAGGVHSLDLWWVTEPDEPEVDPRWQGISAFKRTFGGQAVRHPGAFELVTDRKVHALRVVRERLRGSGRCS